MFLFFSLERKETFLKCILPSFYFFYSFVCLRFSIISVQLKDNIGVACCLSAFKNAVIMLIFYLQKALCLKLSLDIFATNIEKVPKKIKYPINLPLKICMNIFFLILKKNIYSMLFL
jgi:hypothetical protein